MLQKDPVQYIRRQADMGMGPVSCENPFVFKKVKAVSTGPVRVFKKKKRRRVFCFLLTDSPCSGSWWAVVERSRGACRRLAGADRADRRTQALAQASERT